MHPVGDKLKVEVFHDTHNFGGDSNSMKEHGRVVEIPDELAYFGFHSFAFENSIANQDVLKTLHNFYKQFLGKIIYWEALQNKGRRFTEGDREYVILNMSDVIGWDDKDEASARLVDDVSGKGISFN